MRRIKKKAILIIAIVICGILFIKWFSNPERRIFSMVERNREMYETIATQIMHGEEAVEPAGVHSVRVRAGEHMIVDFFVTGFGLAPSSSYYGFYYSPEDLPLPYLEETAKMTEQEEGAWSWKGAGDNKGATKKIVDCWYYYEASF